VEDRILFHEWST